MLKYQPTEAQCMTSIIDWLKHKKFLWWRNNVGRVKYKNNDGSFRHVQFGSPGMSDLFFFANGLFVACEVKTPKELHYLVKNYKRLADLSPYSLLSEKDMRLRNQISFIHNVRDQGHVGLFATSHHDVIEELEKFRAI